MSQANGFKSMSYVEPCQRVAVAYGQRDSSFILNAPGSQRTCLSMLKALIFFSFTLESII